jgi:PRTRC genetic system ThiF family protein
MFSPSEIGANKAAALITRVNRFFGLAWEIQPCKYAGDSTANITVSCVDTAAARVEIGEKLYVQAKHLHHLEPFLNPVYWLDFGNSHSTGQAVLGTLGRGVAQPDGCEDAVATLPCVTDAFNLAKVKDEDEGPSCSLSQALGRQDLFVNSTLAQLGLGILWKLFRDLRIKYHGLYMNLDTMRVNPIPCACSTMRTRRSKRIRQKA